MNRNVFTVLCLYSVMCVQFVPKTHLFFSGGKDKKVKEWDADKFEHIITLQVSDHMLNEVML